MISPPPGPPADGVPKTNGRASVIVSSHNARRTIRQCLSSLFDQDFAGPLEVIVVDSSTDSTAEIIRREFPAVRLIHEDRRLLPGRARNIGVAHSSGEVILFLPADCFAARDWLSRRYGRHAQGHKVVAGSIGNGNPRNLPGWAEFLTAYSRQMASSDGRPAVIEDKGFLFLSYTRDVFDKFGPYPEARFGAEDSIFVSRLLGRGQSILHDPRILFFHLNVSPAPALLRHRARHGADTGSAARARALVDADYALKPLLPLYFAPLKLGLILFRVLKRRPDSFLPFILAWPLILASLFVYSAAYIYGYYWRTK